MTRIIKKIPFSKTVRDNKFIFYFKNQHIYNMLLEYPAIFQGDNNFPEGKNWANKPSLDRHL
ncbi:hypothetical protein DRF60_09900 [Chryseobacterium elymi]|uniref:Uncharacterized protein n=1 Tax=Chryseobacterium elymi TaxID=395936 RepID=A0A3D9DJF5_9FLAO|nr:hypothetical protein DRF60_09900 [Chryseobacterium elymi]